MADEKPPRGQEPVIESGWSEPSPPVKPGEANAPPGPVAPPPDIDIPAPLDFGALDAARSAPEHGPSLTAALFPGEPPPSAVPSDTHAAARATPPPATAPDDPVPARRLNDVLSDSIRLGTNALPLWTVLGGLGTLMVIASVALGLSLGLGISSAGQYADSLPSPEGSAGAHASASSTPAPAVSSSARTLTERVEAGEPGALAELEMNAGKALKADQAVMLARGKAAAVARQARELRMRVDADPTLIEKAEVVAHLREYAMSELTSVDALAAMARLPGPISADLLYEVWTSTSERNSTTELAEHLVYSEDVVPKASPALKVALDLRRASDADSCPDTLAVVKRAADDGDRRDLAVLAKLTRKFGCGPKKKDDCYPCLRDGEDLKRAITESRKRPIPKH